jgi:hypothetical protein
MKALDKLKGETERRRKDLEKKHEIQDNDRVAFHKPRVHQTGDFGTIDLG